MACGKGTGFPVLGSGGPAVSEWDAFGRVGCQERFTVETLHSCSQGQPFIN